MAYDRARKDYRGGPPAPPTEFAEDDAPPSVPTTAPSASGRATLTPYAGYRTPSAARRQAAPMAHWTAPEPLACTLLVAAKFANRAADIPGSNECVVYAHAQGATVVDDAGYPNALGSLAAVATTPPTAAHGVLLFDGLWSGFDPYPSAAMLAPLHLPSGDVVTLNPTAGLQISADYFAVSVDVNEPGAFGNLVDGLPVALTELAAGLGIANGRVAGSELTLGSGTPGYGLVRFTGDAAVLTGTAAIGAETYFAYLHGFGHVPLHNVGLGGSDWLNIDHTEALVSIGTDVSGAWTNLPSGTPIFTALPTASNAFGMIRKPTSADPDVSAALPTATQIELLRQDGSGLYDTYDIVWRGVVFTDDTHETWYLRAVVDGTDSERATMTNNVSRLPGNPTTFTSRISSITSIPAHDSNTNIHTLGVGLVIGTVDSLHTDSPPVGPPWDLYGPGYEIGDTSGFSHGTDPAYWPTGDSFAGGADAGEPTGGLPGGVLVVTYSAGDVSRTLELDLRGGSFQLPPCTLVDVSAFLWGRWAGTEPAIIASACIAPGELATPARMLNTVVSGISGDTGAQAHIRTPAGAADVRVLGGDPATAKWALETYNEPEGVVARYDAADSSLARGVPAEGGERAWLPLAKTPTELRLSTATGSGSYTVQFRIDP